jgi:hypothetical protein
MIFPTKIIIFVAMKNGYWLLAIGYWLLAVSC